MLYLENQYIGHSPHLLQCKENSYRKSAARQWCYRKLHRSMNSQKTRHWNSGIDPTKDSVQHGWNGELGRADQGALHPQYPARKKRGSSALFIMNLGEDQLILGYLWLKEFNPTIDWTQGTMMGLPIKLGTTGRSWKLKWAKHKIEVRKISISQHWAQQMEKDQNKVQVPETFARYANIFSEEAAKRFPSERPEDYKIELLPGASW
jgi:hypothetical protein